MEGYRAAKRGERNNKSAAADWRRGWHTWHLRNRTERNLMRQLGAEFRKGRPPDAGWRTPFAGRIRP